MLFERLEQDHSAGDGKTKAKDDTRTKTPAPQRTKADAEQGSKQDTPQRSRNRNASNRQQIGGGKMQAHTEHQQDNAHFRELRGKPGIGDDARCIRPHHDAGDEIADERRQAQAIGQIAEDRGKHKADSNRR